MKKQRKGFGIISKTRQTYKGGVKQEMYEIRSEDNYSGARLGELRIGKRKAKTPFFMPVATKGCGKHLSCEELERSGAEALIANSFLLYLRPGLEVVEKFNGLHEFMQWPGIIFTDSGGFQLISDALTEKTVEGGIYFRSPYDKSRHFITPEKAVEIEARLGSDVAMALDNMPRYSHDREYVAECTARTHKWAIRCRRAHEKEEKERGEAFTQELFGIVQGGVFNDLREKSAKFINELGFPGIAIGGLAIGETKEEMSKAIKVSTQFLDKEKPKYLMGIGSPKELLESISNGIDLFDSVYPTRCARHGRILTRKGSYSITRKKHSDSAEPLEEGCKCLACKKYSKAYMHHLLKTKEALGLRLASIHNTFFIQELMKEARKAIENNYFSELLKEYQQNY